MNKDKKTKKIKILFSCQNMAAFLELLALANFLKATGKYEPFFYLHREKSNSNIFIPECKKSGIRFALGKHAKWFLLGKGKEPKKPKIFQNRYKQFFYKVYLKIKTRVFIKISGFFSALKIFIQESPCLIILDSGSGGDLNLYHYFIFLGKIFKAPSILYNWCLLLPVDPIKEICQNVDYILACSEHQKDIMLQAGIPESRIFISGKASEDSMAFVWDNRSKTKSRLLFEAKKPANAKIILYAVPQYGEANFLPWDEHWQAIENTAKTICQNLNNLVFLSLHPRMQGKDYEYLEKKFPVKIIEEKCAKFIPLCDIFICMVSSMIPVALSAGIPVVLVNYTKVKHIYKQSDGVFEANNCDEFVPAFQNLDRDPVFYTRVLKQIENSARYFGLIDGKSSFRLVSFIDNLFGKK